MEGDNVVAAWVFTVVVFAMQGGLAYWAWQYWRKTTPNDDAKGLSAALTPVKEFDDFSNDI
jgi:hypothetical protein